MSMYKQIVKLTEEGLKPKEIAKRTKAKISYIYFVRNEVKKAGKKKPSKIVKAVKEMKTTLDALDKIKDKPETTRMSQEDLDFLRTKPKYRMASAFSDSVNHPPHYKAGGIETIDFIEAKDLNYRLGNVIKYVARAGKKNTDPIQDLEKAAWYLNREINARKEA